MFDYLIVGSGLFAATFANLAMKAGKNCLVLEKRKQVGGNIYCEPMEGIQVHQYGAHIFHTNDKRVWDYLHEFAEFNHYVNSPVAVYHGELYNLPFNMNTFSKLWNVQSPSQAKAEIARQIKESGITKPQNLEEQAILLAGTDIYYKLVKEYTEKQWGRPCRELPPFIIKRLPLRFTYDNNYFDACYQGIPVGGYTQMVKNMLKGTQVLLETDYFEFHKSNPTVAYKTVYTGMIDAFYQFRLGHLAYRSLRFETETLEIENYQGNAVVNYTSSDVPYTRIIEHKHFEFGRQPHTVITREYPCEWHPGDEPYYPVNDEKNNSLYQKYRALAEKEKNVLFGGRLGEYQYYDMDKVVAAAFQLAAKEFGGAL